MHMTIETKLLENQVQFTKIKITENEIRTPRSTYYTLRNSENNRLQAYTTSISKRYDNVTESNKIF